MTVSRTLRLAAIVICAIGTMSSPPIPAFAARSSDAGGVIHPSATHSQAGLIVEIVLEDIPQPTDFAFAPDGRIFIASLDGQVRVAEDGQLLPDPFISLPTNSEGQRGLLGLALDPDFERNGYVYLFHTLKTNTADPEGPKTSQLIRVTADGNVAVPGSEQVLVGNIVGTAAQPSCTAFPPGTDCLPADGKSHVGGSLRFATDGTLFVGTGDGSFEAENEGELQIAAQDLDSLAGKILRIYSDGSAPPDNPFFTGDPGENRSKVWAYGLRNPFRLSLQPGTNVPFVGDVGSGFWEEINVVLPGANLGWPCFEGANRTNSKLAFCEQMYRDGATFTHPAYTSGRPNALGTALVAGVFYEGDAYPANLQNALFFADWVQNTISAVHFDERNEVVADSRTEVFRRLDAGSPVDFELHPDGDVYFLSWSRDTQFGDLRHIGVPSGNQAPIVHVAAAPTWGQIPLEVQFSSEGSYDPEGDTMVFSWDFDDGLSSNNPNPKHTFAQQGSYTVVLVAQDAGGSAGGNSTVIVVGSEPPTASIRTPADGDGYTVGDVVSFSGSASDPEDGPLPPDSLEWEIDLRHCEGSNLGYCHTHGFPERTGGEGTFVGPDPDGDVYFLELNLTATDSTGLTDRASIIIGPNAARAPDEAGGTSGLLWVLIAGGVFAAAVIFMTGTMLVRQRFK